MGQWADDQHRGQGGIRVGRMTDKEVGVDVRIGIKQAQNQPKGWNELSTMSDKSTV
jgi:hypothetical protein